jgi:hypothetical protein
MRGLMFDVFGWRCPVVDCWRFKIYPPFEWGKTLG